MTHFTAFIFIALLYNIFQHQTQVSLFVRLPFFCLPWQHRLLQMLDKCSSGGIIWLSMFF